MENLSLPTKKIDVVIDSSAEALSISVTNQKHYEQNCKNHRLHPYLFKELRTSLDA